MKNFIKITSKSGKKKVYPIDKYRLIIAVKTGAVIIAAIAVVILFCGAVVNERHTPPILSVTGIVMSALVHTCSPMSRLPPKNERIRRNENQKGN